MALERWPAFALASVAPPVIGRWPGSTKGRHDAPPPAASAALAGSPSGAATRPGARRSGPNRAGGGLPVAAWLAAVALRRGGAGAAAS